MNTSKLHTDIVLPLKLNIMDLSTVRKNMAGIYKITCPDGCIYIGQSNDIKTRLWGYKRRTKSKNKIHNSIDEKGLENHIFEVIHLVDETLSFNELKAILNDIEIGYIKEFDCFDTPHGLNLTSGGSYTPQKTEEQLKRLSDSHKGQIPWNKGGKISAETKAKISGVNSPMYGKKGELNPNYGRKNTEEQTKAQSERMKGKNKGKPFSGTKMVWTEDAINKYLRQPKPPRNEEYRRNCGAVNKGKKRTEESKQKMRDSHAARENKLKGVPRTPEVKEKLRIANTGKKWTDEQRIKLSKPFSEERKAAMQPQLKKLAELNTGKKHTKEHRDKCRKTNRDKFLTYNEAKEWVLLNLIPLNINKEFRYTRNRASLPKNMPKYPKSFYKDNGWIDWKDFFSYK